MFVSSGGLCYIFWFYYDRVPLSKLWPNIYWVKTYLSWNIAHDILPSSTVGVCKSSKGSRKKGPFFTRRGDGVKRGWRNARGFMTWSGKPQSRSESVTRVLTLYRYVWYGDTFVLGEKTIAISLFIIQMFSQVVFVVTGILNLVA
jgi:hypothetical protein